MLQYNVINMETKVYKQCQSCGKPLKGGEEAGTEANGEKSTMYCHFCYENGAFTQPEMTVDGMKIFVEKIMKEEGFIKPFRWLAVMQVPHLARWKK
jgi:hypothetical protein